VNQLSVLQNMFGEEFEMYFTSRQDGYLGRDPVEFHLEYGVAMFVRKKRNPTNFRSVFFLGEKDQFPSKSKSHAVCIQIVNCLDEKRKKTPFADYFLVSEKYPVKSCRVFSEEVSDHAGLELIV